MSALSGYKKSWIIRKFISCYSPTSKDHFSFWSCSNIIRKSNSVDGFWNYYGIMHFGCKMLRNSKLSKFRRLLLINLHNNSRPVRCAAFMRVIEQILFMKMWSLWSKPLHLCLIFSKNFLNKNFASLQFQLFCWNSEVFAVL